MRVEIAYVAELIEPEGKTHTGPHHSNHDESFTYHEGEYVEPRYSFDDKEHYACSSGIHIFDSREKAREWSRQRWYLKDQPDQTTLNGYSI